MKNEIVISKRILTFYSNKQFKIKLWHFTNIILQASFSEIKEKPFKLERDIQRMFETNMSEIMGLEMIKSEFTIKDRRIDTLAFDPQSKAFVIIEYKRERNSSVIDQGFTYLSLMLQNQADFILEYNETQAGNLKRNDVDWSQTKSRFCFTRIHA